MDLSSVLVAVKGDQADEEAVEVACRLLDPKGTLYLLYVIEVARRFPIDAENPPATAHGEEVLQRMEAVAKRLKRNYKAELLQARSAGCAVVQEAVERDVEAIIIGIPYKERYGSFSLGETVSYVLKNAPCNVIIWREAMAGNGHSNGHRRATSSHRVASVLRFW